MASAQIFHDHIKELRRRILWVVLSIGVSAGIAYVLRVRLINLLQHPLGAPLFYASPAGSFNFVLKLSVVIGMFVAMPVMIYQLLRFVEPALPIRIKRSMMIKIIGSSFLLALAGVAFGFFLMIPMSLHFFGSYSTAAIKPLISADEYLSFVLNHMLTFALAFQIPLVFLFINWIKPLKPRQLLHYQRHVIVGAFGVAIILPFTYDPLSQFIVAIPVVILYYASVILIWITNRQSRKIVKPVPHFEIKQPVLEPVGPLVQKGLPIVPEASVQRAPRPSFSVDGFLHATPRSLAQPVLTDQLAVGRSASRLKPQPRYEKSNKRRPLAIDGVSPLLPLAPI